MLEAFFQPRSIAIIGASSNPAKLGYAVVRNLVEGGYAQVGQIYPINLGGGEILGCAGLPFGTGCARGDRPGSDRHTLPAGARCVPRLREEGHPGRNRDQRRLPRGRHGRAGARAGADHHRPRNTISA